MTAEEVVGTAPVDTGSLVKSRTVILDLRKGNKSFVGSVSTDSLQFADEETEEKKLDPEFFRATKNLINRRSLSKLRNMDLSITRDILEVAIPNHLYKNGYYLLLLTDVVKVNRLLKEYIKKRDDEVRNLFSDDHYEMLIREAQSRLGPSFNRGNYPPAAVIRNRFQVTYQFFPVNADFTFDQLDIELVTQHQEELESIFADEVEKARQKGQTLVQDIESALANQLLDVVGKIEEALTPDKDGKPKTLREPAIDKLNSVLSVFDQRNVTNSETLRQLADQVRKAMSGVHTNRLRYDDDVREQVRSAFHAVTSELSTMVTKVSPRQFAAPSEDI